jgi:hypothetical protein
MQMSDSMTSAAGSSVGEKQKSARAVGISRVERWMFLNVITFRFRCLAKVSVRPV